MNEILLTYNPDSPNKVIISKLPDVKKIKDEQEAKTLLNNDIDLVTSALVYLLNTSSKLGLINKEEKINSIITNLKNL